MTDIFISYKKEDAGRVIRVVEALRAEGFEVWWDHGIRAGSEWDKSIHEHLYAAKVVFAIWSKASVAAPWVKEEATVGKNRGVLLPVKIDEVDPPLGFMMIQAADLVGWSGDRKDPRWGFLLEAVNAVLRNEGPPKAFDAPLKQRPQQPRRVLPLIAGGVALAAVAVAAVVFSGVLKDRGSVTKEATPAAAPAPSPPTATAAPPAAPPAAAAIPAAPMPGTTAAPAAAPPPAATVAPVLAPAPMPAQPPQITAGEQQLWDKAVEEKTRQGFQSYLVSYPGGAFAQRARDILLTCRTETRENWKPSPIGANQTARGVGDTSKGITPEQACAKAKADVRSQAKQICDTITTNGGYRNADLSFTDVPCTCNKTSATITVCVADVPYSCRWEMKIPERVEICG